MLIRRRIAVLTLAVLASFCAGRAFAADAVASSTAIFEDAKAQYNQPGKDQAPVGRYQRHTRLKAAFRVPIDFDPRGGERRLRLSLESVTADAKPLTIHIRALAVADAPEVHHLTLPLTPLTGAVTWEVPGGVTGQRMETPDLWPLVQELAKQPGFEKGVHALLLLEAPDAQAWHYRVFATEERGAGSSARLLGAGAPSVIATPAPPAYVAPVPDPVPASRSGSVASRVRRTAGRGWLEVHGHPYIVLAVQPDAWAIAKATEGAARQFEYARLTGANTIHIPIPWVMVEPERDQYRMDYVDWVLAQARANDLKLTLTWFGSNVTAKTGSPTGLEIVPKYIVDDTDTYTRVGRGLKRAQNVLDPANRNTLEREKRAFERVLRHVAQADREGRVILWQILNEVGVLPDQSMSMSEAELKRNLIAYAGALTKLQKSIHPVPSYMNFWEGLKGVEPFAFLEGIPELDFVGADLYGKPGGFHFSDHDYNIFRRQFADAMGRYHRGRNLPFVPETNTDAYYRTHLSVFYLLGQVPGIGIDVWAVTTGSHRGYDALVDLGSGELEEGGEKLREVYTAVNDAMGPIVRAQGSDRLGWFVSEEGGTGAIRAGGIDIRFEAAEQGAALVAREADGSLVIVARHTKLTLPRAPAGRAERGRFEGARWIVAGPAAQTRSGDALVLDFGPATVVRIPGS